MRNSHGFLRSRLPMSSPMGPTSHGQQRPPTGGNTLGPSACSTGGEHQTGRDRLLWSRSLTVNFPVFAAGGPIKERRCGLGNRARRTPGGEAHGLVGSSIEDKAGVRDFGGLGLMVFAVAAPRTLAVAAHAMGSAGQEVTAQMP